MGEMAFAKDQSVAEVKARAMKQTWQWALWNLPLGGSSGLIQAELGDLSERELRETIRAFIAADEFIEAGNEVLTPSRNLPGQVMAWAFSAKRRNHGDDFGSVTGKPAALQGVDREKIAAIFARELLREIFHVRDAEVHGKQVVMVGFDRHAQAMAAELEHAGARVIAVADASGAVHRHAGLNITMLTHHVHNEGMVYGYPEAEQVKFDQMIRIPCDVLLLADGEPLQLTPDASVILEVCGSAAEEASARAMVVPEAIAGFGLRLADSVEWRKAQCGMCVEMEMPRTIRHLVKKTWREVFEYAQHHELSLASAATALAVSRVAEAMRSL
jgi:glutamate dehydrogenase (NAD(P)+)